MIITNLFTNMIALTLHGAIPTNTPAFQEYAFHEMFNQAMFMATNWNLDLPHLAGTNVVTGYDAAPTSAGFEGGLVFDQRYGFDFRYNGIILFVDNHYDITRAYTPDVKINDAIFQRWMRDPNFLTLEKAQQIAESAMKSVGLLMEKMDFKKPLKKKQEKYEWSDGKVYPLPYYEFYWRSDKGSCGVDVSGTSSNVARFFYTGPYLKSKMPINYFEMLGMPTNAIFVHPIPGPPGKPKTYEWREPVK